MITEQSKKPRGKPNFTPGHELSRKENPLSERIDFRLLPEDKAAFIEAAGGKKYLKAFVLAACHEAVYAKKIRGF